MRIRFRSTFLVTLLTFVGVTAFLVGATSYYSAKFTAEDLSERVLEQTSARVDKEVHELTASAVKVSQLNRLLIEQGQLAARDFVKLVPFWAAVMEVEAGLTSVFIGVESTGECTGVSRLGGKPSVWETNLDAAGIFQVREYWTADYPRTPYSYDPTKPGPDMRGRPWYTAARDAGHAIWTDTYKFLGNTKAAVDVYGVTYGAPMYDAKHALLGVVTADFDLNGLGAFLKTVRVADTGFAFVVEQRTDGTTRLIAHPDGAKDDPRSTALLAANTGKGAFSAARFDVDGTAYLGGVRELSGADSPHWRIGVVVPQSEVLARVAHSNRISIAIALIGLLLAVGCGLYVARQVARPLEKLSLEMAQIAELRLEPRPVAHSIVTEVDRVAIAAEEIKTGLRQKRVLEKYVPQGARDEIAANQAGQIALGGARVRRAILFSDLRGFTAMSERLSPDAVVSLLNTYLDAMTGAILSHTGDINEYIGDAILAVFPTSAQAVAAAVAMQDALAAVRRDSVDEELRTLRMGIGVHIGDVVEGNIGTRDRVKFGVVGDTVNLAARIQDRSRDGETTCIFVSETVHDEVPARSYRLVGDLPMKGKTEPVRVYELTS